MQTKYIGIDHKDVTYLYPTLMQSLAESCGYQTLYKHMHMVLPVHTPTSSAQLSILYKHQSIATYCVALLHAP